MLPTLIVLSILLGLALGSFANVCAYRLPLEQSLIRPGSFCPQCRHPLTWGDNIPLLAYALLGGRCRSCRQGIPARYPIIEASVAIAFLISLWRFKHNLSAVIIFDVLSFYVIAISVIDYEHKIIPHELSFSLLGLGLLLSPINPFLGHFGLHRSLESLFAAIVGGSVMLGIAWLGSIIFKAEALGGGDINLMAAFGALFGWNGIFGSLFLGSFLGGIVGLILILFKKRGRKDTIPFGPFLNAGIYITCIVPISWFKVLFP